MYQRPVQKLNQDIGADHQIGKVYQTQRYGHLEVHQGPLHSRALWKSSLARCRGQMASWLAHVVLEVKDGQQGKQLGELRVRAIAALPRAARSDANVVEVASQQAYYH